MPETPRDPARIGAIVLSHLEIGDGFEHRLHSVHESLDDVDLPEGDFAVYEAKGRSAGDDFPPRFELVEKKRVTAADPTPPKLTRRTVKSFA